VTEDQRKPPNRRKPPDDIEFTAKVKADELRFKDPPATRVSFSGNPGHESVSRSVRRNLPKPVEVGTAYRKVEVDYRLASRIASETSERREAEAEDDRAPASGAHEEAQEVESQPGGRDAE